MVLTGMQGLQCIGYQSIPLRCIPMTGMDTNGMDTYALVAVGADAALSVGRARPEGPRGVGGRNPPPRAAFQPAGGRKRRSNRPLAHGCSPRDNYDYRASFSRRNHLKSRRRRLAHDHRRQRSDRPPPARRSAGPARCRPRRGRRPGGRPRRQHPPRLRNPVAHLHRLVRRGRTHISPRRAPHRGPLPGCPRQFWRQHCDHAARHQRHRQGP